MKRYKTPLYIDNALYEILRYAYHDDVGILPKKEDLESELKELLLKHLEYLDECGRLNPLTLSAISRYTDKGYGE